MLFGEIVGHEALKNTLVASVQRNHVAHAQLFHGPVGSANLALALAYATYLNCEDRQPHDACGRCAACVKMQKLVHPDFHHIFPVASTKKIKDNESDAFLPLWRQFVRESPYQTLSDWLDFIGADNKQGNISAEEARHIIKKLSLKPFEGTFKILLLWQPELLNVYSANALLKILEEPPANTIFLLVCNDANRLLTTILSRTQRVAVPAFDDTDILQQLQQQGIPSAKAQQATYLSEGNMAKAIKLATESGLDQHMWFADWMRRCYKPDLVGLVKLADEYDAQSKETQKNLLEYSLRLFRDLMLFQNEILDLIRLQDEEMDFVQKFSKALKPQVIERVTPLLSEAHYHLERNARAKMVFLDLSLQLALIFRK
jgi:DNA polymerase III subunit delta'